MNGHRKLPTLPRGVVCRSGAAWSVGLCLAAAAVAVGLAACPATEAAEPRRPNVILFLVDDMGWMDSTPYGSRYYETPSIERLAREGMRFTQAYSQPLCSPTRASLLTGQNAARHRITSAVGHTPPAPARYPETAAPNRPLVYPESQTYLDLEHVTLAEALRQAGYGTGHFGKWHLGLTEPHWPERQGFDVAFHAQPSPGPPGAYFSPYGVVRPDEARPPVKGARQYLGTITDGPPGEYITDRLTDEALRFIEAHRDRPFFLNLWHYGVHGPWGHKEGLTAAMAERRDPTGRQDNPVMASMLKSIDESLGRILARLDELGLAEQTVLIFTSDNGGNTHSMTETDRRGARNNADDPTVASYRKWAGYKPPTNNAPLRDGKGTLYEGGVRVPLIVRWPGKIAAGSTSDAIVGCTDVYPTVLDLAGLAPPAEQKIDGVSYAPVLRGEGHLDREAYFIWFPHQLPGVAVRQGPWKLIRRFEQRPDLYQGTRELFHLDDDPGESKNLAAELPERVRQLDALVDEFLRETGALLPRANPDYRPRDAAASSDPDSLDAVLRGLVTQQCEASPVDGAVRITAAGKRPYLGTAQVKSGGPLTLRLRARSAAGGPGQVRWRTADQTEFPKDGPHADFTLSAGDDWQEVVVELPIIGTTATVQLHLPAGAAPVEIESIEYRGPSGPIKAWDFRGVRP